MQDVIRKSQDDSTHPYDAGFRTLEREVEIDALPVEGRLPDWLAGTLVRNGPGRFEVGTRSYNHWFDGLAMLHRFTIHDGGVSYANKYLRSKNFRAAMDSGRISYSEFATDPCRSIFARIWSLFEPPSSDNASVNITRITDRFVALTELPAPVEFDPHTLETLGALEWGDALGGQVTTAHPHYHIGRGEHLNYVTKFGRACRYNVYRMARGSTERHLIAALPARTPAYMHSFGMTEHYVVLAEFPLVVHPLKLALGGKTFAENLRWEPERGTTFWVVRLDDGAVVARHSAPAFFAFHHVNAFERDGEIVVDLCAYDDAQIVEELYLSRLRGGEAGTFSPSALRRFRLPLEGGEVRAETMSPPFFELPRINYERCNGGAYRYAYGIGLRSDRPTDFFNQLVKVEMEEGATSAWFADDCYPGEPVFVAAPEAQAEDDGMILSVVLDARAESSFLLALDARTFAELARAGVPHHIPFGFHGQFFG